MTFEFGKQEPLFLDRQGIRLSFVRMALHLNQRWRFEPRPIRCIASEPSRQIQDSTHDREIAIDSPWTDTCCKSRPHEVLQRVVVNTLQWEFLDVRIQGRQRPRVPFQAALVLVFFQVLRRRLAKRVLLACSKKPCCSCRLQSVHQERFGFFEIACASAFANARAVYDFIDVPDSAAKDES